MSYEIPYRSFLACVLAAGLSWIPAADIESARAAYQKAGKAVVDQVNAGTIDAAKVQALVIEMEKHAVIAAKAYSVKHPAGAKMINMAITAATTMDANGAVTGLGPMAELTFEQIEAQWHDQGIFAGKEKELGIDPKAEANEHYLDPLHTIVHPIMVARAAKDQAAAPAKANLDRMKAEMTEGLEQMEKLAAALK